jgi:hypothetical protein
MLSGIRYSDNVPGSYCHPIVLQMKKFFYALPLRPQRGSALHTLREISLPHSAPYHHASERFPEKFNGDP